MSIRLMSEVWRSRTGGGTRQAILLALADHADDDGGSIFPSVALVAWKVEIDRRTVQRHLSDLRGTGVLEVVRDATPRSPAEYRMHVDRLERKGPLPDHPSMRGGGSLSPLRVVEDVIPGAAERRVRGDKAMPPNPPSKRQGSTKEDLFEDDPHTISTVEALCTLMADLVERNTRRRPNVTKQWRDQVRAKLVGEGFTSQEVARVLTFAAEDHFWSGHIFGVPGAIAKWDKLWMQSKPKEPRKPAPGSRTARLALEAEHGAK